MRGAEPRLDSGRQSEGCRRALILVLVAANAAACGSRTELRTIGVVDQASCTSEPPICVQRGRWCSAPTTVPASCDPTSNEWSCPVGSGVYTRAPSPARCLPFRHAPGLAAVGPWGIGSLARIPADDGRCLWIADSVILSNGAAARNVALEADPDAPFGSCPEESVSPPTPIVAVEGGDDPSILVQIDGGFRLGGSTRVLYRLFRVDPAAIFGVTELGGGIARFDPSSGHVVIPSPAKPFPWGLDLDLGDAAFPFGDGLHELVWGCATPGSFLKEGCKLARLSPDDTVELLSRSGDWIASVRAMDGVTTFESGRWMSTVVSRGGALTHLYIADFTQSILAQTATAPTGTWSDAPGLGPCDLPAADPHAVCAAPITHLDMSDPTRPDELPVTYGVGSTGVSTGNPDDYWPRLVWLR